MYIYVYTCYLIVYTICTMYIWYKLLMVSYNIFERVHIKGRKKREECLQFE